MEGTPFGRYRLIELLGRGGMGEVWRAHDTVTDRIVAIKVLPAHFGDNREFQERFRREAHAAARLNTPHVVPIHDYGEIDGRLFVCMRLIEGRDLQTVLAEGPMEPSRAVRIIEGIALALHAAHEVGLLHRDVKPSNILLDRNDFAYLIDFGIARAADETRLTKTGNTIGTFHYIAPERLSGEQGEDARADIYALACVLYECLTGRTPFAGDDMGRLVAAHLNTPPPKPSTAQPDLPPQIDQVIATGMAKDPDNRYATTVELASAAHDAITTPLAPPSETTLLDEQPTLAPGPTLIDPGSTTPAPAPERVPQQPVDRNLAATQQRPPRLPVPQPRPADRPPPQIGTPPPPSGGAAKPLAIAAGAVIVVVVAIAANHLLVGRNSRPSTISQPSTTSRTVAPVAEAALDGLLLSLDQINTAMGATGVTALSAEGTPTTKMLDLSAQVDKACLPIESPAQATVYAGSEWSAVRGQMLYSSGNLAFEAVVLFSSAHDAGAFFTASAQSWPACANRQYTNTQLNQAWTVGPVSNTNGTLSATRTLVAGNTCQRALTVASNVAIDVQACSTNRSDAAVTIAQQIAAKVPT